MTPPTAPARFRPPSDVDVPAEDLRGSEEEVVAPRLVARLDRAAPAAPRATATPNRSLVGFAILAAVVGLGSVAAALLVGVAVVVGWAARAAIG